MRETTITASLMTSTGVELDRRPATERVSSDESRGASVRTAFELPNYCAACLGTPDRFLDYEQRERYGLESIVSSIRVPICSRCAEAADARRRRGASLMTHLSLGGVVGALTLGLWFSSLAAVWLAAIGPTLGTLFFMLAARRAAVCTIDHGAPFFENRQYQQLFERVNPDLAYSAATRAYLDREQDA